MNFGESSGDCSSGAQENGASGSSDSERPHKKARYPWQIKGKHHLKKQTNQPTESPSFAPAEPEILTPSPESVIAPITVPFSNTIPIDSSRTSLQIEVKPNTNKHPSHPRHGHVMPLFSPTDLMPPLPLETVISLAETMLLNSEIDGNTVSRHEVKHEQNQNTRAGPCTMSARDVRRLKRQEDRCISRWQAAQIVKGCFDNTINRVLESWMNAPAPTEDRFLAMDFVRMMNDIPPSDDNVENEGILMAINAHGLQNVAGVPAVAGIPAIAPSGQLARTLASNIPICEDSDSSDRSEDFEIPTERACSPWPTGEQSTLNADENQQSTDETDNCEYPWRQIHESRNSLQPEPYQYFDNNRPPNGEDYNEYEFINSAVIQAIKSKGLMAAGTDFG
ncbi:Uncharacterized protein OBRU01_13751 [Operophtera brumata]|uniref:Uncharacterized protein n=1 Tax=Operophtera brumata TaxID=104452 RepID=A0A0L7L8C2_OPEBR|nr:Uncharacterized protein OBRU01_13751 [Operophtera brumata]